MGIPNRNIGGVVTAKTALRAAAQAAAASYALEGASIDREKFDSALFHVQSGVDEGTPTSFAVDAKLQDSANGSSWADVSTSASNPSVAITQITTENADRFLEIDLTPLRRYVRLVFTVAFSGGSSPKVALAADAVLGGAPSAPLSHS